MKLCPPHCCLAFCEIKLCPPLGQQQLLRTKAPPTTRGCTAFSELAPPLPAHYPGDASSSQMCNTENSIESAFHNKTILSHQAMTSQTLNHHISFYKYLQLRHLLQNSTPNNLWYWELSPLESICNSEEPQRHLISAVYALLFSTHNFKDDKLVKQLESDLKLDLTRRSGGTYTVIYTKAHLMSTHRKTDLKYFQNGTELLTMFTNSIPVFPPLCWRCNAAHDTLLHIWWECTLIQPFWTEIYHLISQITTFTPTLLPLNSCYITRPSLERPTKNPSYFTL